MLIFPCEKRNADGTVRRVTHRAIVTGVTSFVGTFVEHYDGSHQMIVRYWEYKTADGQWADLSEKLTAEKLKQLEQGRASLDMRAAGAFGRTKTSDAITLRGDDSAQCIVAKHSWEVDPTVLGGESDLMIRGAQWKLVLSGQEYDARRVEISPAAPDVPPLLTTWSQLSGSIRRTG